MDPKACLIRLDQAISDFDWSESVSALNDYYRWRLKGGVEPRFAESDSIMSLVHGDNIADRLSRLLADRVGENIA